MKPLLFLISISLIFLSCQTHSSIKPHSNLKTTEKQRQAIIQSINGHLKVLDTRLIDSPMNQKLIVLKRLMMEKLQKWELIAASK